MNDPRNQIRILAIISVILILCLAWVVWAVNHLNRNLNVMHYNMQVLHEEYAKEAGNTIKIQLPEGATLYDPEAE